MVTCVKCGAEISEEDSKTFNQMCPDCAKAVKHSKKKAAMPELGWEHYILAFIALVGILTIVIWLFRNFFISLVGVGMMFISCLGCFILNKKKLNS